MDAPSTQNSAYALRLARIESRWFRKWIDVQAPYRYNIRRLKLGFVLDVGAGIGRNLLHHGGNGVGVDHNAEAVRQMGGRGLVSFTPNDFVHSEFAQEGRFDSLLLAHVIEHMDRDTSVQLLKAYLPYVRTGGKIVVITPQEAGYASDETHVNFVDAAASKQLLESLGLRVEKSYSFPFPRFVGRFFLHNEFVVTARK